MCTCTLLWYRRICTCIWYRWKKKRHVQINIIEVNLNLDKLLINDHFHDYITTYAFISAGLLNACHPWVDQQCEAPAKPSRIRCRGFNNHTHCNLPRFERIHRWVSVHKSSCSLQRSMFVWILWISIYAVCNVWQSRTSPLSRYQVCIVHIPEKAWSVQMPDFKKDQVHVS